jgi:hypothetical protein
VAAFFRILSISTGILKENVRRQTGLKYKVLYALLYLTFSLFPEISKAKDNSPIAVVEEMYTDVNEEKWCSIPSTWEKKQQHTMSNFFCSPHPNKSGGLFNIKLAKIIEWKEIPNNIGINFVSRGFILPMFDKQNRPIQVKFVYVAVNYKVKQENKYAINGTNYPLFALTKTVNQDWKIAQMVIVPTRSMIANGFGFGTLDEKTFDERRIKFLT